MFDNDDDSSADISICICQYIFNISTYNIDIYNISPCIYNIFYLQYIL